ncbi:hypothetical protein NMG60_11016297 [Bertholletia excelsa]
MELRSCSHLHFIQAIKCGTVEKIRNVDPRGRPALLFKQLKDIYKSEDAQKSNSFSTFQSLCGWTEMLSGCDKVKLEGQSLPLIERKTKERDFNVDEFNWNSDDEACSESNDLNFGRITLKQLKEQCKRKKRKVLQSACSSPKEDHVDWHLEEDDCDLKEPISSWKSVISKNLKGKRKRAKKCSSSSHIVVPVKCEQVSGADDSMQFTGDLPVPFDIKVEASGTEGPNNITDATSANCGELEVLCGSPPGNFLQAVKPEVESEEQISLIKECEGCVVNKISWSHLDLEPNDKGGGCVDHEFHPSIAAESMVTENQEETSDQFLVSSGLEDKEEGYIEHTLEEESSSETTCLISGQVSNMHNSFLSYSPVHEMTRHKSGTSVVLVPDITMGNGHTGTELCHAGDSNKFEYENSENFSNKPEIVSLSCSFSNYSSCSNSNPSSSPEIVLVSMEDDETATKKQCMLSSGVDIAQNLSSPGKCKVASECSSSSLITIMDKGSLSCAVVEKSNSNKASVNHHSDVVHDLQVPDIENYHHLEQCHPPERILSTRKAISPASQEKLCQAMKGVGLTEETDHYKCKVKLHFRKESGYKASIAGRGGKGAKMKISSEGLSEDTRDKVVIRSISKKANNGRKSSPPEVIRRDPHVSRSLQSCSESAIAFSRRQMHDIESLAAKLMQELKSMRDIVEGKLCSEDSSTKVQNDDVDEVRTTIISATKTEETTRKWLSMMARDCNRFCKLMTSTEKGEVASSNEMPKGRRKITFADEAGGPLCHVKYFQDNTDYLDSTS